MLVNQETFNLKYTVTDDWGGSHRVVLDLEALATAEDWKLGISLPKDYKIDQIYNAELTQEGDNTYISGVSWNNSLNKGGKTEVVLIVEEGNSSSSDPVLGKFLFADSNKSNSVLKSSSEIVEDWGNGYKMEVELTAEKSASDWQLNFKIPHKIRAAYGVDLVDNGNGNYTISGKDGWIDLEPGETIKPVFIIDGTTAEAITPQFSNSVADAGTTPEVTVAETADVTTTKTTVEDVPASFELPNTSAQSVEQQGKFSYGEALQKNFLFLEVNRSGDLGDDNRIEWRSDSTLDDGSDVGRDLEGGYFDSGDHIKFIQPMSWSNTMLAWGGIDYREAYQRSGQMDELMDAVKWGTDWFLKTHETDASGKTSRLWVQVGDKTDHYKWVAPEQIDKVTDRKSYYIDASRPGSDAAAGTASALASASMLFRGVDNAYADKLLKNAVALYEFAETYKGKYSDSVPEASPMYTSWSGYWDELAEGGAWLYKATGEAKYLDKAESYFKNNIGGLGDWSYCSDDRSYGAAMILAQESSDTFFKSQVQTWLNKWIEGEGNINYTPGGFAHRAPWASIPITMSTAFAAEWYHDKIEANQSYSDFATSQVDYVLGDNPKNYSYMIGFGDNYPLRPHHRGSHPVYSSPTEPAKHTLYGAIVGGPGSADDYSHNDRRDDAITNEVGTGYNAAFASVAVTQYDNLGGDALSESELDQLIGIDANGVGF